VILIYVSGRKTLFVGSLFLYAVFALAAGFANDPITLDVLTGVMGLFSASAVPPASGILGNAYEKPSKRKNAAFACFSAGNPLGFVFGTLFGGIAATVFNWRASFWLIAIIFLAFTILGVFTVPKDWTDKEPFNWSTIKKFDIVGTLLTVAGIGMFSAAISLGDTASQGWKTGYVLALLIVGVFLLIGFVCWEMWFKYPLVPMSIWRDRNFSVALAILMLGFMAFTPGSFFIALYFQNIWHLSPLGVAVHLLPMVISGITVNIIAGMILHKVSNKLLMYIGTSSYFVAFLLLAFNRIDSSYWSFCFPSFVIVVIGADLEFNVAQMYVMSSMPPSRQSVASGIFQTVAKLCMTLGFGISTAIFNAVEQKPSLASFWDPRTQPYTATFWYSVACAGLSVCLVPLLTIGTQGGKAKANSIAEEGPGGKPKTTRQDEEVVTEKNVEDGITSEKDPAEQR
jgi:MFS family permease